MGVKQQCRSFLRTSTLNMLSIFAKPSKGVHILNGHMISKLEPNIEIFISQLKGLQEISTLIKIEEAVNLICERKKIDDTLIAFSFDDGFEECSTMIAPALELFKTNALFFINPNFVDGDDEYIRNFTENIVCSPNKMPMRWNQIIKMQQAGHLIGAHTMDHFMVSNGNLIELEHQIGDCKRIIEDKTDSKCEFFAFPYGKLEHINQNSLDVALKYYKYVFSQSNYKNYFSFNGKIINRRHFEPNWPLGHVKYFISHPKKY